MDLAKLLQELSQQMNNLRATLAETTNKNKQNIQNSLGQLQSTIEKSAEVVRHSAKDIHQSYRDGFKASQLQQSTPAEVFKKQLNRGSNMFTHGQAFHSMQQLEHVRKLNQEKQSIQQANEMATALQRDIANYSVRIANLKEALKTQRNKRNDLEATGREIKESLKIATNLVQGVEEGARGLERELDKISTTRENLNKARERLQALQQDERAVRFRKELASPRGLSTLRNVMNQKDSEVQQLEAIRRSNPIEQLKQQRQELTQLEQEQNSIVKQQSEQYQQYQEQLTIIKQIQKEIENTKSNWEQAEEQLKDYTKTLEPLYKNISKVSGTKAFDLIRSTNTDAATQQSRQQLLDSRQNVRDILSQVGRKNSALFKDIQFNVDGELKTGNELYNSFLEIYNKQEELLNKTLKPGTIRDTKKEYLELNKELLKHIELVKQAYTNPQQLNTTVQKQQLETYKQSQQDLLKGETVETRFELPLRKLQEIQDKLNQVNQEIQKVESGEDLTDIETRLVKAKASFEEAFSDYKAFNEYQKEIKETTNAIRKLEEAQSQQRSATTIQEEIDVEKSKLPELYKNRDELNAQLGLNEQQVLNQREAIQQTQETVANLTQEMNGWHQSLSQVNDSLAEMDARQGQEAANRARQLALTRQLNSEYQRQSEHLKNFLQSYFSYYAMAGFVMRTTRQAVSFIGDLDKSLREITTTTKRTTQEVWRLAEGYNELGMKVGKSTAEMTKAAAIYYRQGKTDAEVASMIGATVKASALEGVAMEETAKKLTAALNAYQLAADKAEDVASKFAAVGAASATDFEGISTAMTKVGAGARQAGLDIDHLMGILATTLDTLQEAPENIGTSWKTIIARMNKITSPKYKEGLTDDDGEPIYLNESEKALKAAGVSLRDQAGNFRDLSGVLHELGAKWKTLDKNTQSYLSTQLAGTRQSVRFIAAMDNYDEVLKLTNVSLNSSGELQNQYMLHTEGMEAAVERLSAATEKFLMTLTNSEGIVRMIDLIRVLVNEAAKIGAMPILGVGFLTGRKIMKQNSFASVFSDHVLREFGQNEEAVAVMQGQQNLKASQVEKVAQQFADSMNFALEATGQKANIANEALRRVNKTLANSVDINGDLVRLENQYGKFIVNRVTQEQEHNSVLRQSLRLIVDRWNLMRQAHMAPPTPQAQSTAGDQAAEVGASAGAIAGTVATIKSGASKEGAKGILARAGTKLGSVFGGVFAKGAASKALGAVAGFMGSILGGPVGQIIVAILASWLIGKIFDALGPLFRRFKKTMESWNIFGKHTKNAKDYENALKSLTRELANVEAAQDQLREAAKEYYELDKKADKTSEDVVRMDQLASDVQASIMQFQIAEPQKAKELNIAELVQYTKDGQMGLVSETLFLSTMDELQTIQEEVSKNITETTLNLKEISLKDLQQKLLYQPEDTVEERKSKLQDAEEDGITYTTAVKEFETEFVKLSKSMVSDWLKEKGVTIDIQGSQVDQQFVQMLANNMAAKLTTQVSELMTYKEISAVREEIKESSKALIQSITLLPSEQQGDVPGWKTIMAEVNRPLDLFDEKGLEDVIKSQENLSKMLDNVYGAGEEITAEIKNATGVSTMVSRAVIQAIDNLDLNQEDYFKEFEKIAKTEEILQQLPEIVQQLNTKTLPLSKMTELLSNSAIQDYLMTTGYDFGFDEGRDLIDIYLDMVNQGKILLEQQRIEGNLAYQRLELTRNELQLRRIQMQQEKDKMEKDGALNENLARYFDEYMQSLDNLLAKNGPLEISMKQAQKSAEFWNNIPDSSVLFQNSIYYPNQMLDKAAQSNYNPIIKAIKELQTSISQLGQTKDLEEVIRQAHDLISQNPTLNDLTTLFSQEVIGKDYSEWGTDINALKEFLAYANNVTNQNFDILGKVVGGYLRDGVSTMKSMEDTFQKSFASMTKGLTAFTSFHREQVTQELSSQFQQSYDDNLDSGMTPQEAFMQTLKESDIVDKLKELNITKDELDKILDKDFQNIDTALENIKTAIENGVKELLKEEEELNKPQIRSMTADYKRAYEGYHSYVLGNKNYKPHEKSLRREALYLFDFIDNNPKIKEELLKNAGTAKYFNSQGVYDKKYTVKPDELIKTLEDLIDAINKYPLGGPSLMSQWNDNTQEGPEAVKKYKTKEETEVSRAAAIAILDNAYAMAQDHASKNVQGRSKFDPTKTPSYQAMVDALENNAEALDPFKALLEQIEAQLAKLNLNLDKQKFRTSRFTPGSEEYYQSIEQEIKILQSIGSGLKEKEDILIKQWEWQKNNSGKTTVTNQQAVTSFDLDSLNKMRAEDNKNYHLLLTRANDLTVEQIQKVLNKHKVTSVNAQDFMAASVKSGINVADILAQFAHETNWGKSKIWNVKNNPFGIRAYGPNPFEKAIAYKNKQEGLIQGAQFVKKDYVDRGQDTFWKLINVPTHKYATDENYVSKVNRHRENIYHTVGKTIGDAAAQAISNSSDYDVYARHTFTTEQPTLGQIPTSVGTLIAQRMVEYANDDSFGYGLAGRGQVGGNYGQKLYDCTSLISQTLQDIGVTTEGIWMWSGDMKKTLEGFNFTDIIDAVNVKTGDGLQVGDILIRSPKSDGAGGHAVVYVGDGKVAHARSSDKPKADQIAVTPLYGNGNWQQVLRYSGSGMGVVSPGGINNKVSSIAPDTQSEQWQNYVNMMEMMNTLNKKRSLQLQQERRLIEQQLEIAQTMLQTVRDSSKEAVRMKQDMEKLHYSRRALIQREIETYEGYIADYYQQLKIDPDSTIYSGQDIADFEEQIHQLKMELSDTSFFKDLGQTIAESIMEGFNKVRTVIEFEISKLGQIDIPFEKKVLRDLTWTRGEQIAKQIQVVGRAIEETVYDLSQPQSLEEYEKNLAKFDSLTEKYKEIIIDFVNTTDEIERMSAEAIDLNIEKYQNQISGLQNIADMANRIERMFSNKAGYEKMSLRMQQMSKAINEQLFERNLAKMDELKAIQPQNPLEAEALIKNMEQLQQELLRNKEAMLQAENNIEQQALDKLFRIYGERQGLLTALSESIQNNYKLFTGGVVSTGLLTYGDDVSAYAYQNVKDKQKTEAEQTQKEADKIFEIIFKNEERIYELKNTTWTRNLEKEFNYYNKLKELLFNFYTNSLQMYVKYASSTTDIGNQMLNNIANVVNNQNQLLAQGVVNSFDIGLEAVRQLSREIQNEISAIGSSIDSMNGMVDSAQQNVNSTSDLIQQSKYDEKWVEQNVKMSNITGVETVEIYNEKKQKVGYGYKHYDAKGNPYTTLDPAGKMDIPAGYGVYHEGKYWTKDKSNSVSAKQAGFDSSYTTVAVQLPNGQTTNGYIKNGKTFLADGSRVPGGTLVYDSYKRSWLMPEEPKLKQPMPSSQQLIEQTREQINTQITWPTIPQREYIQQPPEIKLPDLMTQIDFKTEPNKMSELLDKYEDMYVKLWEKTLSESSRSRNKLAEAQREGWEAAFKAEADWVKNLASQRVDMSKHYEKLLNSYNNQLEKDARQNFLMHKDQLELEKALAEDMLKFTEERLQIAKTEGDYETISYLLDKRSSLMKSIEGLNLSLTQGIFDEYFAALAQVFKNQLRVVEKELDLANFIQDISDKVRPKNNTALIESEENVLELTNKKMSIINNQIEQQQNMLNTLDPMSFEYFKMLDMLEESQAQMRTLVLNTIDIQRSIAQRHIDIELQNIEKTALNGQTIDEVRRFREQYIKGKEKELAIKKIMNRVDADGLRLSAEQYALLQKEEPIRRQELEKLERELAIQQKQLEIDKLRNQKTAQVLVRQWDGTYDYEYRADEEKIKTLEEELLTEQINLSNWLEESRLNEVVDFLEQIRDKITKAFDGDYYSAEAFRGDLMSTRIWGYNGTMFARNLHNILSSFQKYMGNVYDKTGIQPIKFDTGGYTGGFSGGKLAVLHEKEIVLNQTDTRNLLKTIQEVRQLASTNYTQNSKKIDTIHIDAHFPNATNANEIKKAMTEGLLNEARQKIRERF